MSKNKYITVTVVSSFLREEIVDEIFPEEENEEQVDENGKTKEYYLDLGFTEKTMPDFFKKNTGKNKKEVQKKLNDPGSYEYLNKIGKVKPKTIDFMIDNEDEGCTLYLKNDYTLTVAETAEEI